ncbi:MAG TPA: hypothetical protein VI457_05825 [Methylococcaceae bacterium]|nr:hypothetical protein [Methylococcaceae bacterium]
MRPNAGIRDGFAFLDGHAQSAGAFDIAQTYLLRAAYDLGEALHGLAERRPPGGDEENAIRWLHLLEAAFLAGESGRGAWREKSAVCWRGGRIRLEGRREGIPESRPSLDPHPYPGR